MYIQRRKGDHRPRLLRQAMTTASSRPFISVYVVTPSTSSAQHYCNLFGTLGISSCRPPNLHILNYNHADDTHPCSQNDWVARVLHGHPDWFMFVDPLVYEKHYATLLNGLHRFDQPDDYEQKHGRDAILLKLAEYVGLRCDHHEPLSPEWREYIANALEDPTNIHPNG